MSFLDEWADSLAGGTPGTDTTFSPSGVRMAFENASGLTAQQAARVSELADALNMPEKVVVENPDVAEMENRARQVEQNPRLSAWAGQSKTNAAFVRDDAGLQGVFAAVQEKEPSFLDSWAEELQYGAIKEYRPGFLESLGTLLGEGTDQVAESIAGSVLMVAENTGAEEYAKSLRSVLTEYKKRQAAPLQAESDFGNYGYDFVRGIPQFVAQVGITVGTGGFGTAASAASSMGFMGAQIAGGKYLELTEQGVEPERALYASLADAGLQAPLEQISFSKFLKIFKGGGLGKIVKTAGESIATEFLTEWAQKYPDEITKIWGEAKVKGRSAEESVAYFLDHFGEITREGMYEGLVAAPFGLIGGIGKISLDVRSGRRAQAYADNLMALYDKVEESSTRRLSPAHMQSALEFSGEAMRETVALPADAMLELYQKGTDLLSPLGFTEEQAVKAAAQGQDFPVPAAKLPAYLDRPQMEAATQILRRAPEAMNAAEAARLDERAAADAARLVELYQAQAMELEVLGQEKERLRAEAAGAILNTPGLKAQAESLGGGVDQYVGDWVDTLERYALRMAAAGQSPVEVFRRVSLSSVRNARRGAMSPAEVMAEDLAELQPGGRGQAAGPAAEALVHGGVESLDDLYALASQSKEGFQSGISSIAQATGGQPMFRPGDGLKARARAQEKIDRDYPEAGAKRVLDILGGTILYESRADVEKALPEIRRLVQEAGGEIVRDKDRFDKPSAGYKDHFLNIRQPNGLITELLLTTKAMNQAKTEGAGHLLYEAMQKVTAVLNDKNATQEQKAEAKFLGAQLDAASETYYGSTGDQSSEIASLSGIVEPLNKISAYGASSASSNLYGEVASLLGNIRNMLPSVANTNGLSSNSMNFLMNTGELGPSDSQGTPTASRPSMNRAIKGLSDISEPPSNTGNIAQDGARNKSAGRLVGAETAILLGAHGEQKARYEVRELAEVIPSHDPENQFAKRADYPEGVQERPYHSDAGEQDKVRGNALRLDPRLVVNNNPDLTNGPPAITANGVVLGGNSRAMSIQLAYAAGSERAEAYRDAILAQAAGFGIDASAVAGMERPILVRVVEGLGSADAADLGKLARLYNQTMMQGLQSKAEGIARARLIGPDTLEILAADMAEFDTLRAFLDSASAKRFTGALLRDGVLEETQLSRLTEKNGRLNDAGKSLVENALRGLIVPDYDILAAVPSSVLNKLDRVIPALARLKARGGADEIGRTRPQGDTGGEASRPLNAGWDMSGPVAAALRQVAAAQAEGKKVEVFLAQGDLIETDPDKNRPAVQALALTLANATQKEVQARFELMARDSAKQAKGQTLLVDMPENTPAQSFQAAFLTTVASVDGRSIAPFSPRTNPAHAALEYAYKNGGKGHSVTVALEKLHKTVAGKKATAGQKAEAKELIRELSKFSGSVAVYEPKLGTFFRHREGQELFQGIPDAVGGITPEIAAKVGLRPGAIILGEAAVQHIEEGHGEQIRQAGFMGVREFVEYVLSHVDAVYQGENKRIFEFVTRDARPQGRVLTRLEFELSGDRYEIKTAGRIRPDYYKKCTPLWERAQSNPVQPGESVTASTTDKTNHQQDEHPGASSWITSGDTGQSGEQLDFTAPVREVKQSQEGNARGSTRIYPEGYLVSLFKNADLSTLMHETGHIFFEEMERVVRAGAADETMRRDYEALRAWLGATPGATLTTEQRERVARGFEAYLLEGRAPVEDLQGAFARFRRWLLKIYGQAVNLNVELTDDVRGVFDRMLATEREIAVTAARNELLDLTAAELDALGFSGPARSTAAGLMPKAREAAAESLREARDAGRKARLERFAREALDEVRERPVYKARSDMRKTPLDLQAVRDGYGDAAAEALRKKTPGGFKNDGGLDPEIFALEHGFESGTDMIAQLLEAPAQAEAVRRLVREKETRHDAAYEAFEHLLETREVGVQMELVGRKLAELLNTGHIERGAYIRAARRELATMPLGRAMQTGNFLAAMRRALRQEREAISAGDRKTALEAHRKAMLNMEFVRESREIARRQGVTQRQLKRFIGLAKGDPDARYIVMDIGMRHGLNKYDARLAEGRDARTIQSWLAGAEADGYGIFPDDRVLFGPERPWREMSVADFEALAETVNQIVTVERGRRQVTTAQGKQDLQDVADAIAGSILARRSPEALKTVEKQPAAVRGMKGLHAIHTKIEALCVALDGDRLGPAWEHIYKPVNEAEDRQNSRFREVRDTLHALFGAYSRAELAAMGASDSLTADLTSRAAKKLGAESVADIIVKKQLVPEIGESLSWENRLAVALNMGNETNISRIREGHGWNDAQIAAVLRTLTRRDWEFVQAVWDYIGTFKDEAFALQEEITGLRPAAVEARAFTVQTADGHTLNLRGGYYPIKYDAEMGFLAFLRAQKEMDKQLFGGRNYGAAMTKNGHLKERAEGGAGSPLLLELSVITDHLFNLVHDLEYRRAVLDVAKVIRHKTVREAVESTVGREMYRELMPWLQDAANERQEPMHQIHRWARWARAGTSVMQMGYKITTMLTQPLGFTQSVELLGYKDAAAGLKTVYGNPLRLPELLEETFARSPFMANRIKSFDREVRDFTKQLKPGMSRFGWVEKVKENAFTPMGMFQMSVDLPTWWGAHQKGLRENGGNEIQAALYADSIVRMSQGSGATKDLARVQRGGDLLRLSTMFYSYFNTMYNLGARRIALLKQHSGPKDIFLAANTALLLWFAPAVLAELAAGRGPEAEGEEPDEWLAMNLLQYPFQTVVVVREIASGVFGNYPYRITPAEAAPRALVAWFKAVNKALEERDAGELLEPTAEAAGYLFGLPMKQPIITVGNLWDYLTGADPELYLRDLFFVKPKDRR